MLICSEALCDTALRVGKCSLRKTRIGSGVPGPAIRPGQWGSQILRHPGTNESLGKAKNYVG